MKIKRMLVTLIFGLGLTLGLVWLLGGGQMPRPNVARAAGPHHVAPGGNCGTASPCYATIQAAVDAANPDDVIKVAQGNYTDIHQRGGITQVVYISKTVIVRGGYTTTDWTAPDPAANPTTLDALGQGRVMYVTGNITPTIEGLRLTGGNATGLGGNPWGNDSGGGVYVVTATAAIRNCTVYSNTASVANYGDGGGLFLYRSGATLEGNTVFSNTGSTVNNGYGGGLYLYYSDDATLNGNTVISNTASTGDRGRGGGLQLWHSDASLTGNMVRANRASTAGVGAGGGVRLDYSSATLKDNMIISNTGSTASWGKGFGYGGGLHISSSDATLSGNTVQGNIAHTTDRGYGGGLYISSSNATLSGNTIVNNTASTSRYGSGGGVHLFVSAATLEGNTIISNTAALNPFFTGQGGGLFIDESSPFTLTNNLVADNHANTQGSGLWFDGTSARPAAGRLLHTTIADNHGSGQGVYVGDYTTLAFTNTIVTGHQGVGITVTTGSTVTLAATLWHCNGSSTGGAGVIVIGTVNVYDDPAFVNPSAWDYHLGADSKAIDAGVDTEIKSDIDGDSRPAGAGYDIGADEFWRKIYLPLVLRNA